MISIELKNTSHVVCEIDTFHLSRYQGEVGVAFMHNPHGFTATQAQIPNHFPSHPQGKADERRNSSMEAMMRYSKIQARASFFVQLPIPQPFL
jgi:hypothetical protein